jgi:hypothetical protein
MVGPRTRSLRARSRRATPGGRARSPVFCPHGRFTGSRWPDVEDREGASAGEHPRRGVPSASRSEARCGRPRSPGGRVSPDDVPPSRAGQRGRAARALGFVKALPRADVADGCSALTGGSAGSRWAGVVDWEGPAAGGCEPEPACERGLGIEVAEVRRVVPSADPCESASSTGGLRPPASRRRPSLRPERRVRHPP